MAAVDPIELTDDEATTLGELSRLALESGRRIVEPTAVEEACAQAGVDHDRWFAAMVGLAGRGFMQLRTTPPSHVQLLSVQEVGVFEHLRATRPDLPAVERRVWDAVAAAAGEGAIALQTSVDEPALLVEMLLDRWVQERRLVYSKVAGRRFRIHRVTGPPPGAGPPGTGPPGAGPPG